MSAATAHVRLVPATARVACRPVPHACRRQRLNDWFDGARQTAEQTLDAARGAGDNATADQIAMRLDTYRQQKSWRE